MSFLAFLAVPAGASISVCLEAELCLKTDFLEEKWGNYWLFAMDIRA